MKVLLILERAPHEVLHPGSLCSLNQILTMLGLFCLRLGVILVVREIDPPN